MARGIGLRTDFTGDDLRALARKTSHARQAWRLLVVSLIYDGGTRSDAARHGSVGLQTVRDRVVRFNARGPEGLIDNKSTGAPPRLNSGQKAALARAVEDGPKPYVDGVVRWRLCDLVAWLYDRFRVSLDPSTVSRVLRDRGYRKLTARPRHHAQAPEAMTTFKKTFPT